jgi:hypothetical protein
MFANRSILPTRPDQVQSEKQVKLMGIVHMLGNAQQQIDNVVSKGMGYHPHLSGHLVPHLISHLLGYT